MRFRRFLHRTLAIASAGVALGFSTAVFAMPGITLQGVVGRTITTNHNNQVTYNFVSRADCLQNDVFHFPLLITEGAGTQLEVWVGQGSNDCTSQTARSTAPLCTKVFSGPASPSLQT